MAKGIWVLAERSDGSLRKVTFEILSEARKIADKTGEELCAVILGEQVEPLADKCGHYGADKVYLVENAALKDYTTEGYAKALTDLIKEHQPSILLCGSTATGKDLFPRVATRLETGLAVDCTDIGLDDSNQFMVKRPMYAGKAYAEVGFSDATPKMASIRPNVLIPGQPDDFGALTDQFPNLLILRTFSKLFALAGVRIGYGIIGEGLDGFRNFCARNLGYNRISEQLALAALDSDEYYLDISKRMASDRAKFYKFFRGYEGCEVFESDANFILVKFPQHVIPGLKEELVAQGLIVKFFTEPAFIGYARVSLGTEEENARLMDAILRAWPALEAEGASGGEVA